MPDRSLHLVIRTPREVVVECDVVSLRVPTESGQVGLRPRCEPVVLAVEPGLIVFRLSNSTRYAGSAGGLLYCDGQKASLMTPMAVVGDELATVLEELDKTLSAPSAEQDVRTTLKTLEQNILEELQQSGDNPYRSAGPVK